MGKRKQNSKLKQHQQSLQQSQEKNKNNTGQENVAHSQDGAVYHQNATHQAASSQSSVKPLHETNSTQVLVNQMPQINHQIEQQKNTQPNMQSSIQRAAYAQKALGTQQNQAQTGQPIQKVVQNNNAAAGTSTSNRYTPYTTQVAAQYEFDSEGGEGEDYQVIEDYGLEGDQLEEVIATTHPSNQMAEYYDEVEPFIAQNCIPQVQFQQQQQLQQFQNNLNSMTRLKVKQQQPLGMNRFVQHDQQIMSDMKFCLYCIYNNHQLQQYYKQLQRLAKRLKEWSFQLTPDVLFNIFQEAIKEFMHGIRDRLVADMTQMQMITHKRQPRRYSHDDYVLYDRVATKNYSLLGGTHFSNDVYTYIHQMDLASEAYESVRKEVRVKLWSELRKSFEVSVSFSKYPEQFRKLFDTLIKYYTRVREAVIGIEEIWVFLIEQIFHQELKGNLIFDSLHKQLFKKEILGHRYLQLYVKEIRDAFRQLELRRQKRVKMPQDPIIENLFDVLQQLEEDINSESYVQEDDGQEYAEAEGEVIEGEGAYEEDEVEVVTYQQLQQRVDENYGGQTLAQRIEQYNQSYATSQTILRSIQQDKRCQELLKSLPNLDTETLCYIIQNNLPPEDYERLLTGAASIRQNVTQQQQTSSELVISPSKNMNFLNQQPDEVFIPFGQQQQQQSHDYYENGGDEEEDDYNEEDEQKLIEKKRKKNQKKKLKRKQKKIQAQQYTGVAGEDHTSVQQSRITQYLLENMDGLDTKELREYIQSARLGKDFQIIRAKEDEELFNQSVSSEELEAVEEDPEFDMQLEAFRQKLSKSSARKAKKLVPNITSGWVSQLKQKLVSDKAADEMLLISNGYVSPRQNAANKMGINRKGLQEREEESLIRVRYNQRSA